MKIIIEEIGDRIAISFTGKGKKSDRIKLLMMVMVETLVDGLVSDLTDVFGAALRRLCSFLLEEQYTVRKLIALLKKRQRQIQYLLMVYKRLL